ncbi:hypothetical protein GBF38_004158, partial [Nibea albiflora]
AHQTRGRRLSGGPPPPPPSYPRYRGWTQRTLTVNSSVNSLALSPAVGNNHWGACIQELVAVEGGGGGERERSICCGGGARGGAERQGGHGREPIRERP